MAVFLYLLTYPTNIIKNILIGSSTQNKLIEMSRYLTIYKENTKNTYY